MYKFLLITFIIWRLGLILISKVGELIVPQRLGFLGPTVWANFDGVHYLSIAQNGYMGFQEPFFPLYPLLIRFLAKTIFSGNYLWSGLFASHLIFVVALVIFYKLIMLEFSEKVAKFAVLSLLVFPTSYYFGAVYTESLFLMLVLGSFYTARKEKWMWAGLLGGFATATKLVGVFLLPALLWQWWQQYKLKMTRSEIATPARRDKTRKLKIVNQNSKFKFNKQFMNTLWLFLIPLGLIFYMWYLDNRVGDPLAFIHSEPAFGANRSGGEIIPLPQVYWRYFKIFFTVPLTNYDLWIAVLEFTTINLFLIVLWWAWRKRIAFSYLIFSLLTVLGPTATGTLSALSRYVLVAFPIFILYGLIESRRVKMTFFALSFFLLVVLTVLFTRGFYVA